jgi:hypothetical protein
MKPRLNVQSWVGYRMCFGTRGVVLGNSHDLAIVQDAAGVFNRGRKDNGGVGGRKGYIYMSSGDFLVQGSTCEFCSLTNTKRRSLHPATPPGTSGTTSLETRFSTRREDNFQCRALLWHLIPLLPLRPHPSRSKLSSSQVVPTVQPSNMATNA